MRSFPLSRLITVAIAATLLVGVPVALSGCSLARNAVESATGVDIGDGGVPDDFPTDEVPLVDGEVVFGGSAGTADAKGWNVTINVADATAFDTASAALEAAGFAAPAALGTDATGTSGTFVKAPYTVILVVSQLEDQWVANYTVTYAATTDTPAPTETPAP